MQQKNSLLKLHTTKRERALGALNGTLLCISLSASHKILFWKKGLLKNVILIFVRDGIHSDADYNSTRVGVVVVVVVVVVVRIFTMG